MPVRPTFSSIHAWPEESVKFAVTPDELAELATVPSLLAPSVENAVHRCHRYP